MSANNANNLKSIYLFKFRSSTTPCALPFLLATIFTSSLALLLLSIYVRYLEILAYTKQSENEIDIQKCYFFLKLFVYVTYSVDILLKCNAKL